MPAQIQTVDSKHDVQNSNSGSWTLTYPTNLASGDLIVALMGIDGSRSVTFPTGWTVDLLDVPGSAQMHAVARKISDGTESGNFTVSLNGNERGGWAVLRITGWHGTTVPEITSSDHATNANPDPPSISPSWGAEPGTLFIATFAADNGGWTMDAVPTGYTSGGAQVSSFGGGDAGMGYAYRSASVATENPGTFTISTATNNWVARTIAIRPAAAGGPTTVNLGIPVETNTALAIALLKKVAVGIAESLESALPLAIRKLIPLGQPVETDTALPLAVTKRVVLGQAVESDTPLAISVVKSVSLGVAIETSTALPLTATKSVALGIAVETDAALTLTATSGTVVNLGLAIETSTALPLTVTKDVALGIAVETSTAPGLTVTKAVSAGPHLHPPLFARLAGSRYVVHRGGC